MILEGELTVMSAQVVSLVLSSHNMRLMREVEMPTLPPHKERLGGQGSRMGQIQWEPPSNAAAGCRLQDRHASQAADLPDAAPRISYKQPDLIHCYTTAPIQPQPQQLPASHRSHVRHLPYSRRSAAASCHTCAMLQPILQVCTQSHTQSQPATVTVMLHKVSPALRRGNGWATWRCAPLTVQTCAQQVSDSMLAVHTPPYSNAPCSSSTAPKRGSQC